MADDFDVEALLEETYRRQVSTSRYCCEWSIYAFVSFGKFGVHFVINPEVRAATSHCFVLAWLFTDLSLIDMQLLNDMYVAQGADYYTDVLSSVSSYLNFTRM